MNRAQRIQLGKRTERRNRRFETQFSDGIRAALNTKVRSVIRDLKEAGYQGAIRNLAQDIANPLLAARVRRLYRIVGVSHANFVYEQLQSEPKVLRKGMSMGLQVKRFGFNAQWSAEIIQYLEKFLLEKITFDVNAHQRDSLMKHLQKGINEGWSVDTMVEYLQKDPEWIRIMRYRTARIVRTEIKRAAEVGGKVASESFDYEQNKEWISIRDVRTRGVAPKDHADHYRMDGMVVDADGVFADPRSGAELQFPGDPAAPAGDVINCRCTVAYVAKRDENGLMIPKRGSTSRVSVIRPSQINRTRQIVTI